MNMLRERQSIVKGLTRELKLLELQKRNLRNFGKLPTILKLYEVDVMKLSPQVLPDFARVRAYCDLWSAFGPLTLGTAAYTAGL